MNHEKPADLNPFRIKTTVVILAKARKQPKSQKPFD